MVGTFGHLYLAFGSDYDNVAAHSALFARRHSALPICVLTNLESDRRSKKWRDVGNVEFRSYELPTEDNRKLKTSLVFHSPFALTLYTDADTLILSSKFHEVMSLCEDRDILLPVYQRDVTVFTMRTSQRPAFEPAYERYGMRKDTPVTIYGGGVCVFRNTKGAREFFMRWSSIYHALGIGRDMPSLAFAAGEPLHSTRLGELSDDYSRGVSDIIRSFHGRWVSEYLPSYVPYHANDSDAGFHRGALKGGPLVT